MAEGHEPGCADAEPPRHTQVGLCNKYIQANITEIILHSSITGVKNLVISQWA